MRKISTAIVLWLTLLTGIYAGTRTYENEFSIWTTFKLHIEDYSITYIDAKNAFYAKGSLKAKVTFRQ